MYILKIKNDIYVKKLITFPKKNIKIVRFPILGIISSFLTKYFIFLDMTNLGM